MEGDANKGVLQDVCMFDIIRPVATAKDLKLWKEELADIPFVDPSLEYIGTTKLRLLNKKALGQLRRPIVVQDQKTSKPLAVIIRYEHYLQVQRALLGYES